MEYADFTYYTKAFGGTYVPEPDFIFVAARASRYLDAFTQNKVKNFAETEEVKNACCALAEIYYKYGQQNKLADKNGLKASESIGSYSVSYRDTALPIEVQSQELRDASRLYLAPTGLLYRGGRCVY